ncbi:C2H2 type zinc finger protein [Candidatus Nitrososphaera evergladensis SR1]|jgi:hypothetical protein|uniref:C2H2 type zinc finger protein n=1 Tax=Candidatus Nitrososphaera evergladensis SR1 TaxID=1459636 RepID=A0A075MV98_9ARCH|nr:hypothetical protein [Candidatus Nitrososphaera evergladensis]AIF83199.1 C2H2 type zinc finger protein [Candidatus Nitrososphaera evergladensis SR1]
MTRRVPDRSKDTIDSAVHRSMVDTEKINRAIERVARGDDDFIDDAIGKLKDLQFPAFKHKILEHVRNKTQDQDIIGLFEGLDGYIAFKDAYHIRKIIEENGTKYKQQYQISDETRKRPNFARQKIRGGGIKEREVANKSEERKDYPEIPPTTQSNYICDKCGKEFQNQHDLVNHKRFEGD